MNLREKMRVSGVSLREVAEAVPEANKTAVCHILNEGLSASIKEAAEKLVAEKSADLRQKMEAM